MKRYKLDPEEREIEEAFARGKIKGVKNFGKEKRRLMQAARKTITMLKNKTHPSTLHCYATGNL